jgi:hypothetical protein
VTGDRKYGTEENIAAIERECIHAYIPLSNYDHRTAFFSAERFRYEAQRDVYMCPAGKELHLFPAHCTERQLRYRARAKDCNHCPLKAQCTTNKQGRSVCRRVDEQALDQVRAYQSTEPYQKALRKRSVWVEPLFAEGKDWHGMRRLRLRELERVNGEALMRAAGQNLKRRLEKAGRQASSAPSRSPLRLLFGCFGVGCPSFRAWWARSFPIRSDSSRVK